MSFCMSVCLSVCSHVALCLWFVLCTCLPLSCESGENVERTPAESRMDATRRRCAHPQGRASVHLATPFLCSDLHWRRPKEGPEQLSRSSTSVEAGRTDSASHVGFPTLRDEKRQRPLQAKPLQTNPTYLFRSIPLWPKWPKQVKTAQGQKSVGQCWI